MSREYTLLGEDGRDEAMVGDWVASLTEATPPRRIVEIIPGGVIMGGDEAPDILRLEDGSEVSARDVQRVRYAE